MKSVKPKVKYWVCLLLSDSPPPPPNSKKSRQVTNTEEEGGESTIMRGVMKGGSSHSVLDQLSSTRTVLLADNEEEVSGQVLDLRHGRSHESDQLGLESIALLRPNPHVPPRRQNLRTEVRRRLSMCPTQAGDRYISEVAT